MAAAQWNTDGRRGMVVFTYGTPAPAGPESPPPRQKAEALAAAAAASEASLRRTNAYVLGPHGSFTARREDSASSDAALHAESSGAAIQELVMGPEYDAWGERVRASGGVVGSTGRTTKQTSPGKSPPNGQTGLLFRVKSAPAAARTAAAQATARVPSPPRTARSGRSSSERARRPPATAGGRRTHRLATARSPELSCRGTTPGPPLLRLELKQRSSRSAVRPQSARPAHATSTAGPQTRVRRPLSARSPTQQVQAAEKPPPWAEALLTFRNARVSGAAPAPPCKVSAAERLAMRGRAGSGGPVRTAKTQMPYSPRFQTTVARASSFSTPVADHDKPTWNSSTDAQRLVESPRTPRTHVTPAGVPRLNLHGLAASQLRPASARAAVWSEPVRPQWR